MSIREMHPPPLIPRTDTEAVLDAGMPRLDRPRLVNRKLNSVECSQLRTKCAELAAEDALCDARLAAEDALYDARLAAKDALCDWYQHGYTQACLKLRATQIDENFELAKKYPHFKATKKDQDGYIMLKSMFGDPEPVAIRLHTDTFIYIYIYIYIIYYIPRTRDPAGTWGPGPEPGPGPHAIFPPLDFTPMR